MKRILVLALLVAFSFTSDAQRRAKHRHSNDASAIVLDWFAGETEDFVFTYVDIPASPTFGTTQTHNYSNPGNVTTGTSRDKELSSLANWEQVRLFALVGTEGSPYRIRPASGATFIGAFANTYIDQASTNADFVYLYGRSAAEPWVIDGNGISTGLIRFLAPTSSVGSTWIIQNFVVKNGGVGLHMNDGGTLSGGDASTVPTSTDNYLSTTVSHYRVFDIATEGFYIGNSTSQTAYSIHKNYHGSHLLGVDLGWDGAQANSHLNYLLEKSTFVNVGTANTASQNNLIQAQNVKGVIRDNLFKDAPHLCTIASHDLLIDNNYFRWYDGFPGLIQDYYTQYNTASRLMVTPVGITISNNDFDCEIRDWDPALSYNTTGVGTGGAYCKHQDTNGDYRFFKSKTLGNVNNEPPTDPGVTSDAFWEVSPEPCSSVFDAAEDDVTVTVTNNRFEGMQSTDIFKVSRPNLVDGGGNTFVPDGTIPIPTFTNLDPDEPETHGLTTSVYHYLKGRGQRTPDP